MYGYFADANPAEPVLNHEAASGNIFGQQRDKSES